MITLIVIVTQSRETLGEVEGILIIPFILDLFVTSIIAAHFVV